MEKKNILVTGAGGFLGLEVVKRLIKDGHQVYGLARNIYPEVESLGVDFIACDLSLKEEVTKLNLSHIDAIIHTAAMAGVWGDKDKFHAINYNGTVHLVDKCIEEGIQTFIYTSSPSVVFGKDDILNGDESLPYPKKYYTEYAKSKAQAEAYVLNKAEDISIDFNAVSLRPHLIWGPGDPHLIPRVLSQAKKGRLKVVGDGNNLVDIIHVSNAAMAHTQALYKLLEDKSISARSYFIGQEEPVKLWDFIDNVLRHKGLDPIESSISFTTAYRVGLFLELVFKFLGILKPEPPMTRFVAMQLAKSHYFSHKNAEADFGYIPKITTEEGIKTL